MKKILKYLSNQQDFINLNNIIKDKKNIELYDVTKELYPLLTMHLFENTNKTIFLIMNNIYNAQKMYDELSKYYDEVYRDLEKDISEEILAEQYNDIMRNAYMGNKLAGIIPCIGIFEFLEDLRNPHDISSNSITYVRETESITGSISMHS